VENEIQKQMRELVYDIFSWKTAKYEFVNGHPGNELEFFNPDALGQALAFNISSVLMEAARRDDEVATLGGPKLPSDRQIFIPVDRGAFLKQRKYESEIDAKCIQELRAHRRRENHRGPRQRVTLSEFEVFRCLILFQRTGEIRP